jgi:calcyphosin
MEDLVIKLRHLCSQMGTCGIKNLVQFYRDFLDGDNNGTLSFDEFHRGITQLNINLSNDEIRQLFQQFDKDNNGHLDYKEFVIQLTPHLTPYRINLIQKSFQKIDVNNNGHVTIDDFKRAYNLSNNKKYLNGEWDGDKVIDEFLKDFNILNHQKHEIVIYLS